MNNFILILDGACAERRLERVSDLFSQVQTWFKGELEIATADTIQIKEPAGIYEAPTLSIREKGQTEILANLIPKSSGTILFEGTIEINGDLDQIHLEYMTKGGPQVTLTPWSKKGASLNLIFNLGFLYKL